MWERAQSFHVPSRHVTLLVPPGVHLLGSCWNPAFWVFVEASSWRHDWVIGHWWLNSISNPSPLPGGRGWDWKFQPSNHMLGSPGHQPASLGSFQKSLHWHKLRWGGWDKNSHSKASQGKFKHNFSVLWPPLSPLLCSVYLLYVWTKPPHRQKYLLNHKEQHFPGRNTCSTFS